MVKACCRGRVLVCLVEMDGPHSRHTQFEQLVGARSAASCAGAAAAEMAGGQPIPMLMGRPDNLTTLDPINGGCNALNLQGAGSRLEDIRFRVTQKESMPASSDSLQQLGHEIILRKGFCRQGVTFNIPYNQSVYHDPGQMTATEKIPAYS
jgi:hypothetical protein